MCKGKLMTRSFTADADWCILCNAEGRYSVWPALYDLPVGWTRIGSPTSRDACLSEIEALWQDPRPVALQQAMDMQLESAQ